VYKCGFFNKARLNININPQEYKRPEINEHHFPADLAFEYKYSFGLKDMPLKNAPGSLLHPLTMDSVQRLPTSRFL
jgi:hypothetical protein